MLPAAADVTLEEVVGSADLAPLTAAAAAAAAVPLCVEEEGVPHPRTTGWTETLPPR